jgi:hypothetical protein
MGYFDAVPTPVRIDCVTRTSSNLHYEMISQVGGRNPNGTRWRLSVADAIRDIDERKWAFFVEQPQRHRVNVMVQTTQWGHRYLKTQADGEIPNNLLSLSVCPI